MKKAGWLFATVALTAAGAEQAAANDRFDDAREFIRQQMVEHTLPSVAVAVVKGRKIVWEEGFGWADREKRIVADEHILYSLASVSKPVTATGLMVLVQRGLIGLDQPANAYLGGAKLRAMIGDASSATIRRVANHTAGLPLHYHFFYEDEPWRRPSMDETILRYGFLATPPGELMNYSNLGYGVLDHIIERSSQMTYADFMRREVFQPLGLTRTSVGIGPGLEPYAAQRYAPDGIPLPFYDFDHPGGSAVYSSAHDMARFALFHLKAHLRDQKAILTDKSIETMQRRTAGDGVEQGYGIGFNDVRRNGYRLVAHSGGMAGVATILLMFPDEALGVVVLTNSMSGAVRDIANRIVSSFLPAGKHPARSPRNLLPSLRRRLWWAGGREL